MRKKQQEVKKKKKTAVKCFLFIYFIMNFPIESYQLTWFQESTGVHGTSLLTLKSLDIVSPVSFLSEVRKIRWHLHCLLCQVLLIRKWLQCTMWRRCPSVWLGRRIGSLSEEDGCSILQAAPPQPHFDLVFCMPRICKTKAYVHKWCTNTKDHLFSVLLNHYLHCIW